MHIRDTRNSGPLGKVQHLTAKTQNVNTELGELMMQTMPVDDQASRHAYAGMDVLRCGVRVSSLLLILGRPACSLSVR
jgi:hypothetical protein